ncbi:vWA domain-containing protein [Neptunicella marina]|uniref:VWA domain-containing protein n=1 Tax=Neptunicella marina TaxID=2125989 RepID=A0A8J6M2U5_9ALTE|nr:VWA domain-containing protein [Neptunicella marina]MBC3766733.1 VWA domain-containing protein [Neptunicella marina]
MIDLSLFHFIRPHWLWALTAIPLVIAALSYLHKQRSGWQGVLAGHLYQRLISQQTAAKSRPLWWLLALVWLLVIAALAGPTWERLPQPVYQLNTGKVIVLDMSLSMRATDLSPDRLTRAKFKAIDLVKKVAEGETGLIAYAGDAFTISPLSSDGQNLTALIPSLAPEIMPVAGSDPYAGLQAAEQLLQNAGYQKGEIFWITDGIDNNQVKELGNLINDMPYRVSVLGVGTQDGAPVKLQDGQLLKDSRGAIVIPKMNASQLESLANQSGGRFVHIQPDDKDIEYLTNQDLVSRDTDTNKEDGSKSGDQWREMGPWLLILVLPLAAYAFRKGVLLSFCLFGLLSVHTPQAHASWWDDMWKKPNQRGQALFDKQQYSDAAEEFENPLWKGSAYYKNGDYQAAAEAFSKVDNAQGWYNLGNAAAQMQKYDEAIAAYDEALKRQPDFADAQANKALLEKLKQQQQQQQDQQNQQDQQQKQDQQQEQNQQNNDAQNGKGEGTQQQKQNDQQSSGQEGQEKDQQEKQDQQQKQDQAKDDAKQQEQQMQQAEAEQAQQSDHDKEQQLKMQNLLRKVPDDPSYLLKRKMQLEYQKRKHRSATAPKQEGW